MEGDWTAEVVGRMHAARITGQQLAAKCGYTAAYLSTVLTKTSVTVFVWSRTVVMSRIGTGQVRLVRTTAVISVLSIATAPRATPMRAIRGGWPLSAVGYRNLKSK